MRIRALYADGLRNLVEARLEPHARMNALLGENGQGKTNLLEAIHLATALRPLRSVERSRDLLGFSRERGIVRAELDLDGPLPVEVFLEKEGRRATFGGKAVRDIAEVASRVGVVAFTPEDLAIVRGSPGERRRALDRFAFGLEASFAEIARRYERALEQRNRLLRAGDPDAAVLSSFTRQLVAAGVALVRARARAALRWAPAFHEAVAAITDGRLDAALTYRASFAEEVDAHETPEHALTERFEQRLVERADAERHKKTTLAGPHLDDLLFTVGDRRARHLASQGEARALVLALKLAAVRLYADARAAAPLLLLDDVAGELDPHKAECLFRVVDEVGAQAFVTATHEGALPPLGDARCFHIEAGRVRERG